MSEVSKPPERHPTQAPLYFSLSLSSNNTSSRDEAFDNGARSSENDRAATKVSVSRVGGGGSLLNRPSVSLSFRNSVSSFLSGILAAKGGKVPFSPRMVKASEARREPRGVEDVAADSERGDRVDQLVERLTRGYHDRSTAVSPMRFHDTKTNDNGGAAAATESIRLMNDDSMEVTAFVCNTLDTFIEFGSPKVPVDVGFPDMDLYMDVCFARLLSFQQRPSSILPLNTAGDSDASDVKPLFVGKQATFKSITQRSSDVSSMLLRPSIAAPLAQWNSPSSLAILGGCMSHTASPADTGLDASLDSNAVCPQGDNDADDSWGDSETEQQQERCSAEVMSKSPTAASPNVNINSRFDLAKVQRDALDSLLAEERTSRCVIEAVEERIYFYITLDFMEGAYEIP